MDSFSEKASFFISPNRKTSWKVAQQHHDVADIRRNILNRQNNQKVGCNVSDVYDL